LQLREATKIHCYKTDKREATPIPLCLENLTKIVLVDREFITVYLSGKPSETLCILCRDFVKHRLRATVLEKVNSVSVVLLCRLPAKQHITEEKMAAHLSQLHISPDYTAPRQPEPREDQQQHLKRLVLCEELRKLKQEPILPSSLLSRL
jgi:hypothetical protein